MVGEARGADKRLIWAGTVIVAGLAVVLWFTQPPPGASADPDDAAAPPPDGEQAPSRPPPPADAQARGCEDCADGALCFSDKAVPEGVCTRRCARQGECDAGWCCYDPIGAADPGDFLCAPPEVCGSGRVLGTPAAPGAPGPDDASDADP